MHELIAEIVLNDMSITDRYQADRKWRRVQLRCQSHPTEASDLDRRGRTCLHSACAKRAPLAVVNAILQACGRHGEVVLERDKHGRTPLTLAVSSNASVSVIARLLKSSSRAAAVGDHSGDLPLHLACAGYDHDASDLVDRLLQAFPEGVARENNSGQTPLHLAIEAKAPFEMIKRLADTCPKAVTMDGCGLNPLFVAIRRNTQPRIIAALVRANPEATLSRDRGNGYPLRRAVENHMPLGILQMLATHPCIIADADSSLGNTILHNTLECGIPDERVVRALAAVFPQVALQPNRNGQTPIMIACRRFLRTYQQDTAGEFLTDAVRCQSSLWNSLSHLLKAAHFGRIHDEDPILHAAVAAPVAPAVTDILLLEHPDQVKMNAHVLDATGEDCGEGCHMPLLLAIRSLRQKNKPALVKKLLSMHTDAARTPLASGQTVLSVAAQARAVDDTVLDEILLQHPSALRTMDTRFGLYPFQVAAIERDEQDKHMEDDGTTGNDNGDSKLKFRCQCKSKGLSCNTHPSDWDEPVEEDNLQLTAVYKLLLHAPDLLVAHTT